MCILISPEIFEYDVEWVANGSVDTLVTVHTDACVDNEI